MRNLKSLIIILLISIGLVGCATVDKEAIEAELASANLMTDQEIIDLVSGATISGISTTDGKTKWVQTYSTAAEGEVSGNGSGDFGGSAYNFTWKVKDGKLCEDWGSGKGCWQLELVEDEAGRPAIQRYGKKGKLNQLIYVES